MAPCIFEHLTYTSLQTDDRQPLKHGKQNGKRQLALLLENGLDFDDTAVFAWLPSSFPHRQTEISHLQHCMIRIIGRVYNMRARYDC